LPRSASELRFGFSCLHTNMKNRLCHFI
jgi:hypothetical protein